MGKKYYIKKTIIENGDIYYAAQKDKDGCILFEKDCKNKLIVDDQDLLTKAFNIRIYKPEKIEFEEIKEEYFIANFHLGSKDHTYLNENYIFSSIGASFSTFDISRAKEILKKIERDYSTQLRILIKKDCDNKYDYETGIKLKDIYLYLKLEEMRNYIDNNTNHYKFIRDSMKTDLGININYLKQQGIGGVNDRDI